MHITKTRILLVDDHTAILNKVARVLEGTCEIIGAVTDGQAAMDIAIRHSPDVILMDISLPDMNGIEVAERLIQMRTKARIVFLTVHEDPDFLKAALATGAAGYVAKSHLATDLVAAIEEARAGHRFVSPCLLSNPEMQSKKL